MFWNTPSSSLVCSPGNLIRSDDLSLPSLHNMFGFERIEFNKICSKISCYRKGFFKFKYISLL